MAVTVKDFKGGQHLVKNVLEANLFAFAIGGPGASKTLLAIDWSARLTRGTAPGNFDGTSVNVLYISNEGGWERSIGPRFMAAGGDFNRFTHITEFVWLPSQIDRLEELINKRKARLCVLDPVKDYFDERVYASATKTSEALLKLHALAEKTRCTILGLDWPSKSAKKGDLSVPGNAAFTGKPRQILAVGQLKRDEWVVGTTKVSEGTRYTGWIYGMEAVDLGVGSDGEQVTPRRIKYVRQARPSEVMRAREQADIEDNQDLKDLLQFMNVKEKGQKTATEFKTEDLVIWLKNTKLIGMNKARNLLNSAKAAGYLKQRPEGQGGEFKVWWSITQMGTLHLGADEESIEEAITSLFPLTKAVAFHNVVPDQPALGNGQVRKTRSKTPPRRVSKEGS